MSCWRRRTGWYEKTVSNLMEAKALARAGHRVRGGKAERELGKIADAVSHDSRHTSLCCHRFYLRFHCSSGVSYCSAARRGCGSADGTLAKSVTVE